MHLLHYLLHGLPALFPAPQLFSAEGGFYRFLDHLRPFAGAARTEADDALAAGGALIGHLMLATLFGLLAGLFSFFALDWSFGRSFLVYLGTGVICFAALSLRLVWIRRHKS